MSLIYILKYHPEAKIDFEKAALKYAFISENLEKRFIDSIKFALVKITKNPTFFWSEIRKYKNHTPN
jgi:hypothetical protein